jgi:DNA mismatch repair ATPase MutS
MADLNRYYKERIDQFSANASEIKKKINLISALRLAAFLLGIAIAIYVYRIDPWFTAITIIAFTTGFLFLVRQSVRSDEKKNFFDNLVRVNSLELMRLESNILGFDQGKEFIQNDHPYASDLDIFGQGSVFQMVNRTSTHQGKIRLAEWLLSGADEKEILLRQSSISEMKEKTGWRHEFQAHGMDISETGQEFEEITDWLKEKPYFLNSTFYRIASYLLPSAIFILLILSFFIIPPNFFFFLVIIQLGITGINLRKINRQHNVMTRKYQLFSRYSKLFGMIEDENFSSVKIEQLKNSLISGNEKTSEKIRLFARLIDNFDRRLNMIMGVVLNGMLLWDIHCIIRLEKWRNINHEHLPEWLKVLAEFDALLSIGGFWFNNPGFTLPGLNKGEFSLKSEEISHPLLNHAGRITNSLTVEKPGNVILITGSNMAGKSTFLRSVGVNLVLGMAGGPVCAKHLEFTPIPVFTSMRIGDSILEGESTFYAELKRLKRIIDHFESGGKAMVLLDEIFKGTNSKDKHLGSEILIRQLISYNADVLVATHDLELCHLENELPGKVFNYYFEAYIRDGLFMFDYILRKGICKTMNARELMKQIGISVNNNHTYNP